MKRTIPLALVAALLAAPAYGQNAAADFAARDADRMSTGETVQRALSPITWVALRVFDVGNWVYGERQPGAGIPTAMNPDGRPSSSEVNARQRERAAQRARQQERSRQIDRRRGNDPHP